MTEAAQPVRLVIDASVGVKLFVKEPLSDVAHAVFAGLASDPPARLYVPDLFYIECTNILWKYVQRFDHPVRSARASLNELATLTLRRTATVDLMTRAIDLAVAHGISAYDGCYLALAKSLGVVLLTADEKLARKLSGVTPGVQWLGDMR